MRFDEDLSGIVYNQDMNIASFILSYTQGEEIIIECLYGTKKGDPRYIMAALQGFAREMITLRLLNMYRNITVIEANATVGPLLRRLLDGKYEVMDDGTVKRAEKLLKKVPKPRKSLKILKSNLKKLLLRKQQLKLSQQKRLLQRKLLKLLKHKMIFPFLEKRNL